MNKSREAYLLFSDELVRANISDDQVKSLTQGNNKHYLDQIANLALDPTYTPLIFASHNEIFVEICSRWLSLSCASRNPFPVLGALARVLPLAPHLSLFVQIIIQRQTAEIFQAFSIQRVAGFQEDIGPSIHSDLLTIFRLLSFDNEEYSALVSPAQIQLLLGHAPRPTQYLAIRVLCSYLGASDAIGEKMMNDYLGTDLPIEGMLESTAIDYFFLDLWESKRLRDLDQKVEENRSARQELLRFPKAINFVKVQDLSSTTARIGDILVPRNKAVAPDTSPLISVGTTKKSLNLLASAYTKSSNILVTGPSGAGKTALVHELAYQLGQESSMITLHLNEQTDAKLLVGVYTTENSEGSFSWHPGVLTRAVTEGRWVMVEDLDRAPPDVISTLLPLVERRELLIPNRAEAIRAAPGFKLIATIRSSWDGKRDSTPPGFRIVGIRHWTSVQMLVPTDQELADIIAHRYPVLAFYVATVMKVYSSLRDSSYWKGTESSTNLAISRPYGPQDLFRWCRRLEALFLEAGVRDGCEPISEAANDNILLETVDCFAGFLSSTLAKTAILRLIAKELEFAYERLTFCQEARRPDCSQTDSIVKFGRVSLQRQTSNGHRRFSSHSAGKTPFALTTHSLRVLESVGVAVNMAEPCLLVGETGTGKTAIVQQLAALVGTTLTVVNLSQQSEAGDLLGGYKPMNVRTLAIPILEEFEDLFNLTFSNTRNQLFVESTIKAVSKGRWTRALALWHEALRMVDALFASTSSADSEAITRPRWKRRRVDNSKIQKLKPRWKLFRSKVQTFDMHLSSGSKGFAFSFVEGNIVKAARSGHWVLLDEINLASSDTLESIADLLSHEGNDGRSLLLSETGDAERIRAHENFRIFAAMNPATDVGKRDLPTSFRSRFTEIFVDPPDKDFDNLASIIKAYLGSYNHVDVRASSDIANVYLEIKALAEQDLLVDGSNGKPHFSLRTLTRTIVYVKDIAPVYGLRRALYEGFCMSFLTILSKDSASLVVPIIERHILGSTGSQKNTQAFLSRIPRPPEGEAAYVRFRHYWMPQGSSPIAQQPNFVITPFVERNLLNLVRATMTRRFPVLLQGPTSSGKTSMIEYLAGISGNKFVRINNHEQTDLQEYLGTYISGADGALQFKEGILVRALREGSWIVLDELNLAPTDVLEALNRLLDDNRELLIPETQQTVRPHANFMLFATQNPPGMYGGRKILSRAFRNRFLELHFDDIPEEELETILRERCAIAPSFCTRIVTVYKRLSVLRQTGRLFEQRNSFATLRDLFRWALREADDREQLAINGFLLLAERVRSLAERKAVQEIIEDVMKVSINEDIIYSKQKVKQKDSSTTLQSKSIVWTKSMRRLYVLTAEAFKNNEPVLLVGETGSGKTTICQLLAELMHTKLHTVNAHQNMETGDLIGSHRPIRNKKAVDSELARELAQLLNVSTDDGNNITSDLPALLGAYDNLGKAEKENVSGETESFIEFSRIRSKALFEWMDGSLVQAMRAGEHFLLDEISLADDSVLERLNSVLEPVRMLFLAEKTTDDAPILACDGFQFCATMNPGGDYGKKELSPALRNRFTEIWVPNVDDNVELIEIARDKLALRWTGFAESMVTFGGWFSHRYTPITPSSSIRDLLSWVTFLNTFSQPDDYSAILHGAATVYIDSLGADPAAKISIPSAEVNKERHACLLQLNDIFKHDMVAIYNAHYALTIDDEEFAIGPFRLSISQGNWQDPRYSLAAPTAKANALRVVRALQLPKPMLLEGSPGVGKTTLIVTIAAAIGMPLTRINLSDQTDLTDLFGSDVPLDGEGPGNFGWRQAPFLRAMQNGEWVLLDEMNLASQSVLEGLNACLDHRGEVYVSELGQTYSKHPNFVLFAAQNPRHQGGGRKGLPSSFVDRFTVVCVDEFTLQDQLMICRQAFPECADEVLEKVTRCISAVNTLLHDNPAVGVEGGPWEYNLRDTSRWLHMMTDQHSLLSAATAEDFLDLLILQRLRTSEDAIAISQSLGTIMPRSDTPRSQYRLVGTSFLQVGLGFLSESNTFFRSAPPEDLGKFSGSQYLESMILCVQNRWPCLLVGPSGSGKTYAITQLARTVGAEVVTMHMNVDTDIMDLIGGYEQADPQRSLTTCLEGLRKSLRKTTIGTLQAKGPISKSLNFLNDQMQLKSPDLAKLVLALRAYAEEVGLPGFAYIADEVDAIVQRTTEDSKGRFAWADGMLVKALQEGSWLILDHANLCNPSVLDRLNSLLEPNGSLIINERRSLDGSAPVIKPHPSFRMFLTADSRHGELSRAMRNRCVELHLPAVPLSEMTTEIAKLSSSNLVRFRSFESFDWNLLTDASVIELVSICFDHLACSDWPYRHRWTTQVITGLLSLARHQSRLFSYVEEVYDHMMKMQSTLFSLIQTRYEELSKALIPDASWAKYATTQTLHPMNNPPLVQISKKDSENPSLQWLGSILDLSVELCKYDCRIQNLEEAAKTKSARKKTVLERSFAPSGPDRSASTLPIGMLLRGMAGSMQRSLSIKLVGNDDSHWLESMEKLLVFQNDIVDVLDVFQLDEGSLQVYLDLGRSLACELMAQHSLHEPAKELLGGIEELDDSWRLSSGQSMERLWLLFDAAPAKNNSELEARIQLETFSDRFDSISWSSGVSVEQLHSLRTSISNLARSMSISFESAQSIQDLQDALEDVEKNDTVSGWCSSSPYFRAEFEGLRQYRHCEYAYNLHDPDTLLEMFAGRPTRQTLHFRSPSHAYKILSNIADWTGISQPEDALVAVRGNLALDTLLKIKRSSELPLRSLDSLRDETRILASRTASLVDSLGCTHHQNINQLLSLIYTTILAAYSEPNLGTSDLDGFRQLDSKYFKPSFQSLQDIPLNDIDEGRSHATAVSAIACIQVFRGCLLLYIPNRPFDPASRALIERDRHRKRRMELQNKLQALITYEQAFTKGSSNLRCHELQQKLHRLGDEPPVRAVARPLKSNLTALQTVLSNILISVVNKIPSRDSLEAFSQSDLSLKPEVELLRSNIARHIARLTKNEFHTYNDITNPLILMLQGLDVGLALLFIAHNMMNTQQVTDASLYNSLPFLGMRPGNSYDQDLNARSGQGQDSKLMYLQLGTVIKTITSEPDDRNMHTIPEVYHNLYNDWRQQLSDNQKEHAARSSLYKYRGSSEDQEETLDDLAQLFLNDDRTSSPGIQTSYAEVDPRMISVSIARIHREMFKGSKSASQQIVTILKDAGRRLGNMRKDMIEASWSTFSTKRLLPVLILELGESREDLQTLSTDERHYNFYTDAHLNEAQKLISILQNIQQRFTSLRKAWPEQATISDVLRVSNELLDTRYSEPIGKLLTKTEQLHGYIHEWQLVASKEYSASILYDRLTELLVSWRRLELLTWARLLELEDEKCIEDVEAWWFVAYEVIVAAPLSIIKSGQELGAHTEPLLDTLIEFLRTTSLGHYSHRMKLIEYFVSHLELLAHEIHSMQHLANALKNFLNYYWRFEPSVQDSIQKGRLALEKEMKEVVLLASWKDTNINALRDSAKRSHHRLFKVVRKYRALLAQPAQSIIEHGLPQDEIIDHPIQDLSFDGRVPATDLAALRICEVALPGWATKPLRFKDPGAAAFKIIRMTEIPASSVDSAIYLQSYATILVASMESLQRETPSSVTKDNKSILKHLKARKRNLFTNTIKDIRQMGFRQNLNESALKKQASTSKVLMITPVFSGLGSDSAFEAADLYFHRLLDIIPRIKASASEHSGDLSQVEVVRSMTYLESILSVILEQRAVLAKGHLDTKELGKTIDTIESFWMTAGYELRRATLGHGSKPKILLERLQWLPTLLETGCVLLKKHGELGDIDHEDIIRCLADWKLKFCKMLDTRRSLAKLPEGLSSSIHDEAHQQAEETLRRLNADLKAWSSAYPKVVFVLSQIEPWTDLASDDMDLSKHNATNNATIELEAFDEQISQISDTVLVAVQQVNAAMVDIPTSTEDPSWLIQVNKSLTKTLNCFRAGELAQSLNSVMNHIQHLPAAGGGELRTAAAYLAMALPILRQFKQSYQEVFRKYTESHTALCKLASILARSLAQVISRGFCSPTESSSSDTGKADKVENGMGLGEGEGAEDISKDIGDDEDLSELAHDGAKKDDREDIENEGDAVDMDHDEMEGEVGDGSESEEGGSADEKENDEIDEEIGKVDDLDAGAVDEKLWDGGENESEAEKEDSKGVGKTQNPEETTSKGQGENEQPQEGIAEEEDNLSEDEAGSAEEVVKEEAEKLDQQRQDKGPLDLPEEMDIDVDDSSTMSDVRDSEVGEDMESEGEQLEDEHPDVEGEEEKRSAVQQPPSTPEEAGDHAPEGSNADSPLDTDTEDNGPEDDSGLLKAQSNDKVTNQDNSAPSEAQGGGHDSDQHDNSDPSGKTGAEGSNGEESSNVDQNNAKAGAEEGDLEQLEGAAEASYHDNIAPSERTKSQAFKKLGDALEKWHRQQQEIREAGSEKAQPIVMETETTNQVFEHLQDENAEADDTQALGEATEEQAHGMDSRAMDTEMREPYDSFLPDELDPEDLEGEQDREDPTALDAPQAAPDELSRPSAFIGSNHTREAQMEDVDIRDPLLDDDELMPDPEGTFPENLPPPTIASQIRSLASARRLWLHYENVVHPLSLILTEQLRLILTPTQATKMRGDFRTGKRLNIKRIIPYIASNYKRDKIWMRRSVPQKRNYQIMLAVDDSKSMGESGSGQLAFEALVLVSKSLSMLEVGEICVVGFGDDVKVVHEFEKPFSAAAGISILQQLGFKQTRTNVRKLVQESITLFREAKAKAPGSSSSAELWQLLLIMSDGLCEDHDEIRRLVRQAQDERIMIVFVIVDGVKGESIINMSQAVFEDNADGGGGQKLKIKRYLEGFPFMYYLVVGDVKELPGVLATALRQWFSEVVGQGG